MKDSRRAEKLNALLGIKPEVAEKLASDKSPLKADKKKQTDYKSQPRIFGYTDDEFKNIRIMQGTFYFLQAPELFATKQCANCNEWFTVSRGAVGFCSYECIAEKFRKEGLEWTRGADLDNLVRVVYEGNEPLWTMKTSQLKRCLQVIIEATESSSTTTSPNPKSIQTDSSLSPTQELSSLTPANLEDKTGIIGGTGTLQTPRKL